MSYKHFTNYSFTYLQSISVIFSSILLRRIYYIFIFIFGSNGKFIMPLGKLLLTSIKLFKVNPSEKTFLCKTLECFSSNISGSPTTKTKLHMMLTNSSWSSANQEHASFFFDAIGRLWLIVHHFFGRDCLVYDNKLNSIYKYSNHSIIALGFDVNIRAY